MKSKKRWIVRKILTAVLIVGLILGGAYGVALCKFYSVKAFDASTVESAEGEITVMSSNVRNHNFMDRGDKSWYVRAEMQLEQIAEVAPDIVGFQEVKHSQEFYFNQKLKGYDAVVRYREKHMYAEATPIYYRSDKFNLIESGGFWLSETPEVRSTDWGTMFPRICCFAVLEEKASGKRIAVFNTHLDHTSNEARINGIQVILNKIEELGNLPAILMGDMNDDEGSLTYSMATENFIDVKYYAKDTMTAPTFNGFGSVATDNFNWLLDYFLITPTGFEVDSYKVLNTTEDGVYRSDHFPIVCKLHLK